MLAIPLFETYFATGLVPRFPTAILCVALMLLGHGVPWWSCAAAVSGFGMAMLYPNLSAAVADLAPAAWRGSAIGIYRFWRDLGYAIGALGLALAAQIGGNIDAAFWFVAASMLVSGTVLARFGAESHPRLVGVQR